MLSQRAKKIISAPLPAEIISERDGGRGGKLSYISGQVVIDMLNNAFEYDWDWEVQREWIQQSVPKFNPKYDKEPVEQPSVAHVVGKLTVRFTSDNGDPGKIVKTGHGSKVLIGGASEQESIFKSADTDALKKAATKLGIGLELYRNEDEQAFVDELENPWTEEALEFYKKDRQALKEIADEASIDEEMLNTLTNEYTQGQLYDMNDLLPIQFPGFVSFVQEKHAKTDAASKKPLKKAIKEAS